ncbi:hypothetical protein RJ639_036607 [Escallonia herrerae]|uniref:Uncharacterized protein n=1 Tax=Escallonia herrerae TaxID=1293975 RepID=A0AA88WS86_9ASTE|nr:hypothetical protein RJ639_036607 [Escallonia herrerae]
MNQDLVKLDRFDGNNYARWKDKMMFLLIALRISYILDPELLPPPKELRTSAEGVPLDAEEIERDYRKKLLHKSEDFTLEKKHLCIEEESRKRENKVTIPVESNLHYVDVSGSQSKNLALQVRKNDEQFKKKANQDGEQKKKKGSCYVWDLWREDRALEVADPSLGGSYQAHEVLRCIHIGLLCVQEFANDRPSIDIAAYTFPIVLKTVAFAKVGVAPENQQGHSRSPLF